MDFMTLKANKNLVKGFLSQRIKAMQKEGISKDKVIDYYRDLLEEMRQEKLFDEVIK